MDEKKSKHLNRILTQMLICSVLLVHETNDLKVEGVVKSQEIRDHCLAEGIQEGLKSLTVKNEEKTCRRAPVQDSTEIGRTIEDGLNIQAFSGLNQRYNIESITSAYKVCYDPYGCFTKSYPWNMPWHLLPQPPWEIQTKFYIYTTDKPTGIRLQPNKLHSVKLTRGKVVFIVHGWRSNYEGAKWIRRMKDEFLKRGDSRVIGVYWGRGANVNYFQAAGNTRLVGAQIAHIIESLHNVHRIDYSSIHIIGYSLGAQIAGFAGRRLRGKGSPIARITGLDPAGPFFKGKPIVARLDATDALFVDVIYTSVLSGLRRSSGHASFFVNRGFMQPGCGLDLECSHSRAVALFMRTILPMCRFMAYKCNNYILFRLGFCNHCSRIQCTVMGYDTSKTARGSYYVRTGHKEPFC